ncbi:hypothetical protein JCM11491_001292 [Sporobolomyces phaffii]
MPLQRRRPVPLVPLPDLDRLEDDTPVFYLKATGEIFLDYESYSSRLSFLLTRTFQCEYSGKSHLDYFTALQSEKAESKIVRERFPDELKGRVLASVQFQVMGRLDKLVDLVYDRYKDRYFVGEKVFVDLSGDKYYARIAKVFPPQVIRDEHHATVASSSSSATPAVAPDDYASILHRVGTDLDVDAKQAKVQDPAEEYLYTVQLMDEEHKFEGSFMEVKHRTLSRDRLAFSKSILKRYMRECVQRDASTSAPWTVKPSIARAFGIETTRARGGGGPGDNDENGAMTRDGKVPAGGAKRKKAVGEGGLAAAAGDGAGANKKRKTGEWFPRPLSHDSNGRAGGPAGGEGPKKSIKYPIEDLDLDPMSIHDGRVLRRTKTDVPTLPPKPLARRALPVPTEHFDLFLETWNMLNTFSKPLSLSPFTLDDLAGALTHDSRAPGHECVLLAEVHASLTNIIGTDASRVLGSSSILATMLAHGGGGDDGTTRPPGGKKQPSSRGGGGGGGDETPRRGGTPQPNGDDDEVDELEDDGEIEGRGGPEDDEVNGGGAAELTPDEIFFGKLIKRGIQYGQRWDRQAKLKSDTGRAGWERHLIGAMCQRGGPYHLDRFVDIMKHLFHGDPILLEEPGVGGGELNGHDVGVENGHGAEKGHVETDGENPSPAGTRKPRKDGGGDADPSESDDDGEDEDDESGLAPQDQYLTLSLGDKLAILNYLVTLVMGSKPIRAYLDEADRELTDLRKQRADVNKERRALLERKAKEGKKGAKGADSNGKTMSPSTSRTTGNDARNKSPAPSASRATSPSVRNDDDEDELLTSDAESSIAPSDAGSVATRQAHPNKRLAKVAAISGKHSGSKPSPLGAGGSKKVAPKSNLSLDEQIDDNALQEEFVDIQFRRYLGVSRCRPLGKDRFHCRYWWFDGIGGMDISKARDDGARVPYATGRIFVQGPSALDWEVLAEDKGEGADAPERQQSLTARRVLEEVVDDERALVGFNEWGYYETPEELDALQTWLNSKGSRELALKNTITRWRDYIVAGSVERYKDLENPTRPRYDPAVTSSGRPTRNRAENDLPSTYLGYRNQWKKY